MIALRGVMQH